MGKKAYNLDVSGSLLLNGIAITNESAAYLETIPASIGFTLDDPVGLTQVVNLQILDINGQPSQQRIFLDIFMSLNAEGSVPSSNSVATGVTIIEGEFIIAPQIGLQFQVVTNEFGVMSMEFDNTGGSEIYDDYMAVVGPTDHRLNVSPQLSVPF